MTKVWKIITGSLLPLSIGAILAASPQAIAQPGAKPQGKLHLLPATLETTQWGWLDNSQAPVLRVESGDTIVIETMMHSHNQVVPGITIEEIKKLRTDFPGRGPHTLTGPIYVNGAAPGDVLRIKLNPYRSTRIWDQFQRPGHVRAVSEGLPGWPGQILVS